jgi:hypothetical protein
MPGNSFGTVASQLEERPDLAKPKDVTIHMSAVQMGG